MLNTFASVLKHTNMKALLIIVSLIGLAFVMTAADKIHSTRQLKAEPVRLDDKDKLGEAMRRYHEMVD